MDGPELPAQPEEAHETALHGQAGSHEVQAQEARGHDQGPCESRGGDSGCYVLGQVNGPGLPAQPAEGHGTALHGRRGDGPAPPVQPAEGHETALHGQAGRPEVQAQGDGAHDLELHAESALERESGDGGKAQHRPESGQDEDCVVLMAWGSGIPPWRRTYTARDRWLKQNNDEGWHRRRQREWKRDHWRGSSPSRSKGKGKKRDKVDKKAGPKAKARPYSVWSASGRKEVQAETVEEEDEDEVVEVENESGCPASRASGPRPDQEPFTVENAMHIWREFLDMEDEGELGYPGWALDRVRDTIAEWPAEDVSILLAAHQQFLSLVMAQVAEIAQQRIAEAT